MYRPMMSWVFQQENDINVANVSIGMWHQKTRGAAGATLFTSSARLVWRPPLAYSVIGPYDRCSAAVKTYE